jgi:methyl-accepting chemotaxis protein/methyl-accepting chemotaxis protein-1 (serine sensor receptor)
MIAGILLAGVSMWNLQSLAGSLNTAINKDAVKLDLVNSIRSRTWEMVASMRGVYLWASLKNDERVEGAQSDWDASRKRISEIFQQLRPLLVTEEGQKLLAAIESHYAEYDKVALEYMRAAKQRDSAQVGLLAPKAAAVVDRLEKSGDEFRLLQLRLLKESDTRSDALRAESTMVNISLTVLLLAAGVFAIIGVRGINRTLRKSIMDLSEGGEQVAAASGQIAATSQSLSQGASEQAASLEEVSASMEEITAMAKRNSENSTEATGMMGETASQVERSNGALHEMVASMSAIKSSSEKVAKIIKTIDEIAFQTNILALNAAVEAARAGEAGMGFAVVADEVRNLAQRSAVAAKDTASLIEEAIANSNLGAEKLEHVAVSIRAITESATKVRNLVDEVSESSKQQTLGINQTATAVTQVSQVTQTAAASAEESAAAAEELSAQAQNIRDLVRTLRVMVDGSDADSGLRQPVRRHAAAAGGPRHVVVAHKPGATAAAPVHATARAETHSDGAADLHHDPFPMDAVGSGNFRSF